jgi:hypothetical protein
MTYEIKDNPVHGKLLAENGKLIITSHADAVRLSERFTHSRLVKAYSGRYMVQLPSAVNSIEECDCQASGIMMPGSPMPQTYNQHPDHEVQMARQELYRAAKLAFMTHELMKQVSERQGIEGWVASKITRAADYIETVFDYLDYEMRYPSEMMEAPMNLGQPAAPGQGPADQNQPTPGQQPDASNKPGLTKTPGMVKMAKVDTNGNVQGQPIMVPVSAVKSKQQAGFHVIGESASAGASGAGGMATSMGGGTGFASGGIGTMQRRKRKRTSETTEHDTSHLGPYDCGGADAWYGRRFNPHKYVALPNGTRQKVELTDPAEIAAYKAGYENEGGQGKDYGESVAISAHAESVDEANYQGWVSNPQANIASRFAHDPDRAAVNYKPNKYDPVTGLGGYIAPRAGSNDKSNIMVQLNANLDSAYSKPIRFNDGSQVKISPNIARKALNKLNSMRPVQRHAAVKSIIASKDAFVSFVKDSNEGMAEGETGPKFTGYWKGTNKGKPGNKMVGSTS